MSNNVEGIAHIKKEFIVDLPSNIVEPVDVTNTISTEDGSTSEPPTKKQKKTGRNKNRPWVKQIPRKEKLCPHLWSVPVGVQSCKDCCAYPNCDFSHDSQEYLANKPSDLEGDCPSFLEYGKCRYGITCRYGSQHLDGVNNCFNEELMKKFENNPPVVNMLTDDIQKKLWKRKYDTQKAEQVSRDIQKEVRERKRQDKEQKRMENGNKNVTSVENNITNKQDQENIKETKVEENNLASNGHSKIGPAIDFDQIKLKPRERKRLDWRDKLYLAPLTTVGNLPFRRVCKALGADITCSEMAVATNILKAEKPEWALVKRHSSEDFFGVQLCSSNVEMMVKCTQVLSETTESIDFFDINMGCPIDLIYKQGAGSALMRRQYDVEAMVRSMQRVTTAPITLKMRTSIYNDTKTAHEFIRSAKLWDVDLITVHGRSREQRYLKSADWDYIDQCAQVAAPVPLFGNGDVFTYEDYNLHKNSNVAGIMIARGALIKPWIFTEIKEQRHWDISSKERLDILKQFVNAGLEHWGSDTTGIEKTRRFLLEWWSFLYRYIPVGLLEVPQAINQRPPQYRGRDDLETLMASKNCTDWVKLSEMLLGKVPDGFQFLPKHKANAWG